MRNSIIFKSQIKNALDSDMYWGEKYSGKGAYTILPRKEVKFQSGQGRGHLSWNVQPRGSRPCGFLGRTFRQGRARAQVPTQKLAWCGYGTGRKQVWKIHRRWEQRWWVDRWDHEACMGHRRQSDLLWMSWKAMELPEPRHDMICFMRGSLWTLLKVNNERKDGGCQNEMSWPAQVGGLEQVGSNGRAENWRGSGCIWNKEQKGFANRLPYE